MTGIGAALTWGVDAGRPARAAQWEFVPRLEVSETYTDNVRLAPNNRQGDFVSSVAPGLSITGLGRRGQVIIDYTLSYLYFPELNDGDVRHNFLGSGTFEVIRDWFFVSAQGSISEQFLSQFGSLSISPANQTANRRTVQSYNISPSLRHRFGSYVELDARYTFRYFNSDRNPNDIINGTLVSRTTTQSVNATLTSGQYFWPFKWRLNVSQDTVNRLNRPGSFGNTRANGEIEVRLISWLDLIASGGYEKFRNVGFTIDNEAATWDVGARFRPGPRTDFTARFGRRFGDNVWSVNGRYAVSSRTAVIIQYREDIDTTQLRLGRRLGNIIIGSDGTLIDPTTGVIFDPSDPGFDFGDQPFRAKRFSMSLAGSRKRNRFNIQSYYERRTRGGPVTTRQTRGVSFSFNRQQTRKVHATVFFTYRKTDFEGSDRRDKFYGGSARLSYRLGQVFTGELSYNRSTRDSNFGLANLTENAATLTLRAVF